MALQLPYTAPDGVEHPAAYARVSVVQIIRTPRAQSRVRYWLEIYADSAKSQAERASISTVQGEYKQPGISVTLAEIYSHAKGLPEFQEAADV